MQNITSENIENRDVNKKYFNSASYYGTAQVHKCLLEMLDEIDRVCRKNKIKYSLSGGTLLGAIRHNGFIPWDDDADIMFERKDFEKFLKAVDKDMKDYHIAGHDYIRRLAKKDIDGMGLGGKCIDLFVFDAVPQNIVQKKVKILVLLFLQAISKKDIKFQDYSIQYRPFLFIAIAIGKLLSLNQIRTAYDSVSKWGNKALQITKINIYNTWFNQIRTLEFDSSIVDDYINVNFENRKFMAICGYDLYLSNLYGDYMKVSPKEKQKPIHSL